MTPPIVLVTPIIIRWKCNNCKLVNSNIRCIACFETRPELQECSEYSESECSDIDCSICLEPFINDIYKTKCSHFFHTECLKQWKYMSMGNLCNHDKCPNCRRYL